MAQRDYIVNKRSTVRRKGAKQRRRMAPPPSKAFVAIVLALFCSFGAALYWLKSEPLAGRITSSPLHAANPTIRSLPPKPQEKWKYIKTLENKKVITRESPITDNSSDSQAATKPSQTGSDSPSIHNQKEPKWLLQCGVFHHAGDARSMQAQLALLGIESQLVAKGDWKQLLSENYASQEDASERLRLLQQNGINDCKIIVSRER